MLKLYMYLPHSGLLDPSIAASATAVWLGLIIIVGGWYVLCPWSLSRFSYLLNIS